MWSVKAKCQNQIIIFKNFLLNSTQTRYYKSNCFFSLGFIRTKLLPFAIVSLFGLAFFAVSARIWLPGDMMSPAPIN